MLVSADLYNFNYHYTRSFFSYVYHLP